MSSNLIRRPMFSTNQGQDETRVIDTNELIAKKIQAFAAAKKTAAGADNTDGFVSGLFAETVELSEEGAEEVVVAAPVDVDVDAMIQEAKDEAAKILDNARKQSEVIVNEAKEQAELVKNNILEEARKNGYRDGIDRAKVETDEAMLALANKEKELIRHFDEQFERLLETMEPDLVDCITNIYEHIFNVDMKDNKEILLHLISTTIRRTEGTREFLIHVSKEDYPYVNENREKLHACLMSENARIELVEDLTVQFGECLIETEGGIFDCGLGTQLDELNRKLKVLSYTK